MLVSYLVNDGDLVDSDIRYLVVLVPQIKYPGFDIHDIATKRRVSTACYIDLLTQQLL